MEPRYLLDTNICIYIRQNRPEKVLRRFRKLRPGEAALSVITYGELLTPQVVALQPRSENDSPSLARPLCICG